MPDSSHRKTKRRRTDKRTSSSAVEANKASSSSSSRPSSMVVVNQQHQQQPHKNTPAKDNDGTPQTLGDNDEGGDGDDTELTLLNTLLDGDTDDFRSKEDRAEQEAQRRRAQRRKRLPSTSPPPPPPAAAPMTNTARRDKAPPQKMSTSLKNEEDQPMIAKDEEDDNNNSNSTDSDDDFDMFSSSVSPITKDKLNTSSKNNGGGTNTGTAATTSTNSKQRAHHEQEDWDDAEGYYKANIGEIIMFDKTMIASASASSSTLSSSSGDISFRVSGVIGKGVFSTVLKCTTVSNSSSIELPPVVALKCIRHNDTMAKAAMQELQMLQRLKGATGIVPLLFPTNKNNAVFEYRGHVVLIFSYMEYNLRDVLQKFGKGVGLSLQAVKSYFGQLLAAATHLKKHKIIHADIKLDNVLVRADFGAVQLADFGSAMDVDSAEAQTATPYLVSRFYRAPEIILGLVPTYAIDLWSLAVSVAELFLGNVLFTGKSNNDMLFCFMQHIGPFSNRMIRQHVAQGQRLGHTVIPQHFQQDGAVYLFKQQTMDPISGATVYKMRSLLNDRQEQRNNSGSSGGSSKKRFPLATPLNQKIVKARSGTDSRSMVIQFSDLLQKCLTLDPTRRIDLREALRHDFFTAPIPAPTETATAPSDAN